VRSITGHTAEAAQDARKPQFAMMDHFGLNSLFLTITPNDEFSFYVRLYANPDNEMSYYYFEIFIIRNLDIFL